MARTMRPPTPQQMPITTDLWRSTQELISPPTEEPSQRPLVQWPPPPQGVPSRKFCWRLAQEFASRLSEAQVRVQEESSQAYVSLVWRRLPITVLHWRSRLVHWPLAHFKPEESPQLAPSSL